jgi:UDP-2,4-diacetamido-2,4,6-trideoxy-beta-L-altropyranose hydrolase
MKVVFRTDASVQIGTGHLMRCLTLANELALKGHSCHFICRNHQGHLGSLIIYNGHELTLLPQSTNTDQQVTEGKGSPHADWLGVTWQQDALQTLEILSPLNADWLVVDHYSLAAEWEKEVSKEVGRIMVIDDLADRNHQCDLLLDQNLGREVSDYASLVPEGCTQLIGPSYALLRPEFTAARESSLRRRQQPELGRILISLGGVDRTNATGRILQALTETALPDDIKLDIVMGASAPYLDEVRKQAARLPFDATVNVSVSDMADRMSLADLSIGAAGSTSWERCCLGVPSIIVILAENQRLIGEALERNRCALLLHEADIGSHLDEMMQQLRGSRSVLDKLAGNAARICDGLGSARLVSLMIKGN